MSLWCLVIYFFFFKQKTAYEMRISDWSSDVCSSDLEAVSPARAEVRKHEIGQLAQPLDLIPHLGLGAGVENVEREAVLARHRRTELGRASCRESVCQYV